ncbi:MAG TPA: hypothetical protein VH062_16095 [Polyangiaceae bacterium]|jgi:hypothetical protein|nr:hypothetical protein [Polyangiaceae bacterium]
MGKDFFRLVELAIASGALIVPGVVHADETARAPAKAATTEAPRFVVQSARLDRDGLTITFSKPLRVGDAVDPGRFRLTFAYYSKTRPGDYSYYYEYYGAHRATTSYENVGAKVLSARIDRIGAATVRIRASQALDLSGLCKESASVPASAEHAGLYLHFASRDGTPLASTDGAALESIAPYWLTKDEPDPVRPGALAGKPIPVSLSCR